MGPPLVLDLEPAAEPVGPGVGIGEAGRVPLAEGDDRAAVVGVGDVERQEAAEPPEVAPGRVPAAVAAPLGLEAVEVEDHLDGPAVDLAEVHHPVLGVGRAAGRAGQVGDETHRDPALGSVMMLGEDSG